MGIEYAIMMHALAEKYCGAKPVPMEPKFLRFVQGRGCNSKTEIYQDVAVSIRMLESANLKLMAAGGDPNLTISEQQARNWAKDAAEQLGGCERLIEQHDRELDPGR